MPTTAFEIFKFVGPFVFPVIMMAVAFVAGVVCVAFSVKNIKRQIKLYNSITLVELRCFKLHYWIFALLNMFFMILIFFQMIDPYSPETQLFKDNFSMQRLHSNLLLGALELLLLFVELLLIVLARSKSAIVDKGIYTTAGYLDWYDVHDYIIDEEKGIVIVSSEKDTFSTIAGTTIPLRVSQNDVEKLKFILNKNKNRFSGFSDREHRVIR